MEAASRDFLTMVADGVTPPISRALTNSMRSPPLASMMAESAGLVEITYSNILMVEDCIQWV